MHTIQCTLYKCNICLIFTLRNIAETAKAVEREENCEHAIILVPKGKDGAHTAYIECTLFLILPHREPNIKITELRGDFCIESQNALKLNDLSIHLSLCECFVLAYHKT